MLQHETLSRYHIVTYNIILLQFYPCSWVSPKSFKLQQRINISPLDWYSHSKYITQTHNKILCFLLFSMLFKNLQWIFVDYLPNENHFKLYISVTLSNSQYWTYFICFTSIYNLCYTYLVFKIIILHISIHQFHCSNTTMSHSDYAFVEFLSFIFVHETHFNR